MNPAVKFDEGQIRREIKSKRPGIYELRILMTDFYKTVLSAYFDRDNPDQVIRQMLNWRYPADCCINFYLTVNPVKHYCFSREQYDSIRKCRIMSQDDDIERLTWLALDIDPDHPAGTSASNAEKAIAWDQAQEVQRYMDECGFEVPEVVDSGNGFHLKYRIDFPNDDNGRTIVSNLVDSLREQFPMIDPVVKNPARILKLPGTIAMKGRNTEERPFRPSYIIQDAGEVQEDNAE